jgi:hypothetical protein
MRHQGHRATRFEMLNWKWILNAYVYRLAVEKKAWSLGLSTRRRGVASQCAAADRGFSYGKR